MIFGSFDRIFKVFLGGFHCGSRRSGVSHGSPKGFQSVLGVLGVF